MITAKEARFETKYQETVNDILHRCEEGIKEAIKDGEYHCTVMVDIATPEDVFTRVKDELKENGYKVTDTNYRNDPGWQSAPCDQAQYWEELRIDWEGKE